MHISVDVRSGVTDMGELLISCDAAVGAAGTSVWERCVLGIPTLLISFAENQRAGMIALDKAGAGVALGDDRSEDWKAKLGDALIMLSNADVLRVYSESASAICDGLGADRVAHAIASHTLTLREARLDDAEAVWDWRRGGGADRYYRSPQGGDMASHIAWFKAALADRKRHLLIFELDSQPVGHIRLDILHQESAADVSICINSMHRGAGLGSRALKKLIIFARMQGIAVLYAEIHRDNVGSLKVFTGVNFAIIEQSGLFVRLRLTL
jgi:RimJ/RimL family protein N-acetyltransferase